ncbi:MAG: histidinol dehydrogenase [Armatimonadota bacterium]|nr:histidinol dehydrogenase [Armatimonadota bacterium]MDR7440038.1 histidinol dehydrogenase [Armatimonadota bacterium]MDR7562491.1 histidinol dehydrogenase [Armatimonadota bacterium]MDR7566810.1 histidinol dehydrogenase [Armatimonadota bacterium]MDR7601375.1 histidinol dehydrogenase [Armatimonadota bacterium]
MRILRLWEIPTTELRRLVGRSQGWVLSEEVTRTVRAILEDVRNRGDEAVLEATRRFDGVDLSPDRLRVDRSEIRAAYEQVDAGVRAALETAIARVRRFSEWLRPPQEQVEELEPGLRVGIRITPLASVGAYIPSGKGSFPSTVVTMVGPAVVAGVEEIALLVPPRSGGSVDPATLVAADLLGIERIYRANGPAGIAALAVGTATFPRVEAVVGPGNPYVVAMQMLVQTLGVRMLALLGPTEIVVLADHEADPYLVALDLLNEAEHGSDSAALLVTPSEALAREVHGRLQTLVERLPEPRRTYARDALSDLGGILVTRDLEEAVAFVNLYAPEHLVIHAREAWELLRGVRHAGEILLGPHTPPSAANYAIGVPAALPTGGASRFTSAVTVWTYLKISSVAQLNGEALARLRSVVERLGHYEGFPAHVMSVRERGRLGP